MNKLYITITALLCLTLLQSCSNAHGTRAYGKIDQTDKTMTIAAGGYLIGSIKDALVKDGWTLKADSSIGKKGKGSDNDEYSETIKTDYKTRYRFDIDYVGGRCYTCSCVDGYNLTIIDNKSGQEIIAMSNNREQCFDDVTKDIIKAIHDNQE